MDGKKYHPGAVDILEPHMRVRVVPEHMSDPANMDQEEIEYLISNAKGSVSSRPPMRTRVR